MNLEKEMEEYIFKNPRAIGFTDIKKQFRVTIEGWLGKDDTSSLKWSRYSNRSKPIDLIGLNEEGKLVLCELKYGGGGDGAPYQLLEYYLMLQHDKCAQVKLKKIGMPSDVTDRSVCLYIVVAGHVSELLKKQIEIIQRSYNEISFKVFQAIPPDKKYCDGTIKDEWRVYPIPEETNA